MALYSNTDEAVVGLRCHCKWSKRIASLLGSVFTNLPFIYINVLFSHSILLQLRKQKRILQSSSVPLNCFPTILRLSGRSKSNLQNSTTSSINHQHHSSFAVQKSYPKSGQDRFESINSVIPRPLLLSSLQTRSHHYRKQQ